MGRPIEDCSPSKVDNFSRIGSEQMSLIPNCVLPEFQVNAQNCIANELVEIELEIINYDSFYGNGIENGNPNGFDLLLLDLSIDSLFDTGIDITPTQNPIQFIADAYEPFALIQLVGIDIPNCSSDIELLDLECFCDSLSPTNDACINAIELVVDTISSCNTINAPFSLQCATVDSLDPNASCFNNGNDANVWFSFVAPCSGNVQISTDYLGGTLQDTEIALYSGYCGNLTELDCDQDGGFLVNYNSILNANNLLEGETYYILVDKWGAAPSGNFCIDVVDTNPIDSIENIFTEIIFSIDTVFNGDSIDLIVNLINPNNFDIVIDSLEIFLDCDSTLMNLDSLFVEGFNQKNYSKNVADSDTLAAGDTLVLRASFHAWVIIIDDYAIAGCCVNLSYTISNPLLTCNSSNHIVEICLNTVIAACPEILLINMPLPSGVYEADDKIVSNIIIDAAANGPILYHAGGNPGNQEYILLDKGTFISGDFLFEAHNIECDTSD